MLNYAGKAGEAGSVRRRLTIVMPMTHDRQKSADIVGRQKSADFCCHTIDFCHQFSSAVHINKMADSSDDEVFTPVNSSQAHNKATSHKFFICMLVRWHLETVLNTDGVIMASEHTTRHTQCHAVWFGYLGLLCAMSKSPMTAKPLNATNARSRQKYGQLIITLPVLALLQLTN